MCVCVCVCVCVRERDSYVRIIISCCQTTRHRTFVISEKNKISMKICGKAISTHAKMYIVFYLHLYIKGTWNSCVRICIFPYTKSILLSLYHRVWTTSFSLLLSLYMSYLQISSIAIYLESNISRLSSCIIR